MAHTIEDKIIELADKYTLNHSNESYLNNKAMLEDFRAYLEQEIREADARKACEWIVNNFIYYPRNTRGAKYLANDFCKAMEE